MMKNRIFLLLIAFGFSIASMAQDPKAKVVLDKLKNKTESYKTMIVDFEYNMKNTSEDIDESQTGKIMIKDNKYNLKIAGQRIISDGKTIWTVLEEAEEVQVNNIPEDSESEDYISPDKILTIWENGFKYKYDQASTLNGNAVDIINLYPEAKDDKSFHTIKLYVNQEKSQMDQIVIKGKDGTDYIYKIKNFDTDKDLIDSEFIFSTTKNPSFDVIDLR